jgi:uncharacterized protein YukE
MKFLFVLILGAVLFGCANSSLDNNDPGTKSTAEHQDHHSNMMLVLDQGQKWKVNPEMLPPIEAMEARIKDFKESDSDDYQALASDLQKQIDLLVASCTMTGPSHDELHKWLHPTIQMVKNLSNAKDQSIAAHEFESIQQSIQTYHQYFQ